MQCLCCLDDTVQVPVKVLIQQSVQFAVSPLLVVIVLILAILMFPLIVVILVITVNLMNLIVVFQMIVVCVCGVL